ncbi:hypothetical protein DV736_g5993, partial [Chaetothyriales sp. CBS 134916]
MLSSVSSFDDGISDKGGVQINAVPVRDIESLPDQPSRRLKHLLRLNHVKHAVLYNNLMFHNHTPHVLGSAYFLNVSANQLDTIYDDAVNRNNLEPWQPSPNKIAFSDYRDYLGKGQYQRAWIDFFEDQNINHEYQWQRVVAYFLFETGPKGDANSASIFCSLTAGLGHPLIHLGYAYELNSQDIAAEALCLAATCYDANLASLLTAPHPSPTNLTSDLFSLFSQLHNDTTFPIYHHPDAFNIDHILANKSHVDTVLSYLNSWTFADLTSAFSQSQRLAALLLIATSPKLYGHGYDFFFVHLLNTTHAVRVILPNIPPHQHITLLREWLLTALLMYVSQNRPKLEAEYVTSFELANRDWDYVRKQATEGPHASDAHFVKACRVLIAMSDTWGNGEDKWFLRCAVRFAVEFEGWGGFEVEGERALRRYKERVRDGVHM